MLWADRNLRIPVLVTESSWMIMHLAGVFAPGRRPRVYHSRTKVRRLIVMVKIREVPIAQAAVSCRIGLREAKRYMRYCQLYTSLY